MSKPDSNFFDSEEEAKKIADAKDAHILRMRDLDDLRWVLSNIKGMRFVWRIWGMCGTFRASYVQKDSTHTAFNEGQRDIGLRLLLDVNQANPKAFSQIQDTILSEEGKKNKKQGVST